MTTFEEETNNVVRDASRSSNKPRRDRLWRFAHHVPVYHAALHSRVKRKSCGDATVNGGRLPAAYEISVAETIALLEADFPGMAGAVARGSYALWLGSGISLDRVAGVPAVIARVIENLPSRLDSGNPACRYKAAH